MNLLHVPTFQRLDDFVGLWAYLPERFNATLNMVRGSDLLSHIRASTDNPPRLRSALTKPVASNGKTIAVVRVVGTLMKSQSSMGDGTSTVQLRRDIREAVNDPDVSAILLAIDSPGGTVAGTDDLAKEVANARKAKPVWAQVDDLAASAAYWVASQAERIISNSPTAMIGSIGTYMGIHDMSGLAEKEGVRALMFSTGPLKGAGALPGAPISEAQQANFQKLVDESQVSFDAAVKKGRGLSEKQLSEVRSGAVYLAEEALSLKLIDTIQSYEKTFSDLSKVTRPKSAAATVHNGVTIMPCNTFSEWLTAKGFGNHTLDDTQRGALETAYRADVQPSPTPTPVAPPAVDISAQLAEQAAVEIQRQADIQQACMAASNPNIDVGGKSVSLAAHAIAQRWNLDKVHLEILRAARPTPGPAIPNIIRGAQHPDATLDLVLEAALCSAIGSKDMEKHFKPEVLESAHQNFRHATLQQVVMVAAVRNGYPGTVGEKIHQGNYREVVRYSRGVNGRRWSNQHSQPMAGASSIGMSGILGNVANKEIVAGYMEDDNTWREIAQIKTVSNFQQYTTYRMLDEMEFAEIGPGGKFTHGTAGQESYTRQVKTYGRMFGIDRTQLINDDLSAFSDIKERIGRGHSKKLNKVFWTAFMSNLGTIFTTARTNYISGATTNLGTDGVGLTAGILAFRKMTSPNGTAPGSADGAKRVNANTQNPIGSNPGGRPEILLVPPDLEGNAEVLYRNQNLGQVANSSANIHQNKYRPVQAWQLSNSGYTGYSTTHWFLLNNPSYLAPMVVSFLNGQQTPTVEEQEGDFDELCYLYRAYGDFGCDTAEYLAGVMSKGAA